MTATGTNLRCNPGVAESFMGAPRLRRQLFRRREIAGRMGAVDFVDPARLVRLQLLGGRGHYDTVVQAVMQARRSVWIATANLKELMVEDPRAAPGRPRAGRSRYRSILEIFDQQAGQGIELRILHATPPSRAFRAEFDRHPRLYAGGLELRTCPRVHFKAVVVDASLLYLGSANWTGRQGGRPTQLRAGLHHPRQRPSRPGTGLL
jgi:hypothetical protein